MYDSQDDLEEDDNFHLQQTPDEDKFYPIELNMQYRG
jgi:hypothetical protein